MRFILRLVAVLVVASALTPGAVGVVAPPAVCVPSCSVPSQTSAGFLPPLTMVTSGAVMTWSSLDVGHSASEVSDADACFDVRYTRARPGSATFVVADGTLLAANVGEPLAACEGALASPDGSFAVPYVCYLHPNTMTGTIVVK